jgi:hypothetical protein
MSICLKRNYLDEVKGEVSQQRQQVIIPLINRCIAPRRTPCAPEGTPRYTPIAMSLEPRGVRKLRLVRRAGGATGPGAGGGAINMLH